MGESIHRPDDALRNHSPMNALISDIILQHCWDDDYCSCGFGYEKETRGPDGLLLNPDDYAAHVAEVLVTELGL